MAASGIIPSLACSPVHSKIVSAFDLVSVSSFLNFGLCEFIVPHKKEHHGSTLSLREPERVLSVLAHPGFEPGSLFLLGGPHQWFPNTSPLAEVQSSIAKILAEVFEAYN